MSCRLSWNGKESILYTSIVQQYGTKVADDVLTRVNSDQFATEFGDYKTNSKMDLETIPLDPVGQEPTLDWLKENQSEYFQGEATQQSTQETSESLESVRQVQDAINKELPIEIGKAVTVVQDVPQDILGRDDLFLSLKEILNENGISDEVLINWAGANRAKTGDIRNFKSTEQLLKVVEKSLANLRRVENYPELKTNKLAQESFENWKTALKNYSPVFQEIMLSHAIKFLRDPNRRAKFVLQLSPVALTATHGILMNKPHEANRLGKLYDSEVLKTVSDAVGHEPSASGKGYWIHISRASGSLIEHHVAIKDNTNDPKAPAKFTVEYMSEIDQEYEIEFFETREAAETFARGLGVMAGSDAQFKVNVELLKKLSPSTWCTASGMASYYVENYDNYLLVVNGVTVAGIEAGDKGGNGKTQVKEVTSRANNGVSSIDHLEDIEAFFEKHNLDTDNRSLQNARNAKNAGKVDAEIKEYEYEYEYAYDPEDDRLLEPWEPRYRLLEPWEPRYPDLPIRQAEVDIANLKTVQETLQHIEDRTLPVVSFFEVLPQELKDNKEIATKAIEHDFHNIVHVNTNAPFYNELLTKAVEGFPYVFNYLPQEVKDSRSDLKDIYDRYMRARELDVNDDLPFSKTSSNKIQGYYDAKNDKVVVVASNTSVKEAARVAIHEVAHRGMIRMAKDLGGTKELNQILLNSEKELMKKLPELLERTGHKNVEELVKDYGFDVNSEEGKAKLLMELAARWAETLVDKPKPSWWKEFLTSIQNWIKKFTGKVLDENEVNELVGGFVKYGTQQSTRQTVNPANFTNHSGGARGYDAEWDLIGNEFGFINHRHYLLPSDGAVSDPRLRAKGVLPIDASKDIGHVAETGQATGEGQIKITQAERQMGRNEPTHTTRKTKKIRNWAQVKNADAVFAIGSLLAKGDKITLSRGSVEKTALIPQVNGGTSGAVQMAINENKPVYVFNQVEGKYSIGWYKWSNADNDFIKTETPVLTKNFAGVGTSTNTTEIGKQAIRDVYEKTLQQQESTLSSTQSSISSKALEQEIRKVGKPLLSLNLLSDKEIAAVKTDRVKNLKEHNRIKKELELLQKINDCLWN